MTSWPPEPTLWFDKARSEIDTKAHTPGEHLLAFFDVLHEWLGEASAPAPTHALSMLSDDVYEYLFETARAAGQERPHELAGQLFTLAAGVIVAAITGEPREANVVAREAAQRLIASASTARPHEPVHSVASLDDTSFDRRTRHSTDIFEGLLESAPDAIIVVDSSGLIRLVNRQTQAVFGYDRAELIGQPLELLLPAHHAEHHPALREKYLVDPRTRPMGAGLDLTARRKDGTEFRVDISLSPLRAGGELLVSAAVRDITEHVAASRAHASLAAIISSSSDAVIGKTLEGVITSWNPAAERLYGYTAQEAVGRNANVLLLREQAFEEEEILSRVKNGEHVVGYESTRATKSRRNVDVSISESPILDSRGTIVGVASTHRDISDRKRAEAKLQSLESQRLESLGQLAGGVAHDFNNLLAAILNYAGLIEDAGDDIDSVRADVAEIKHAAERGAALTRQLLIFGRREVVNPTVIDLNAAIADLEKLLGPTIGENIDVKMRLAPDLWRIETDPTGIEQILMNLLLNARDAMKSGGMLLIQTENTHVAPEMGGEATSLPPGDFVRLSITDSGEGMSADVIARAFEPFFTTKPKGQGTGLGLATVYGIVAQAGGEVHIDSDAGVGTVVRAYFPALKEAPLSEIRDEMAAPPGGLGETILVVEDEEQVRLPTIRLLTRRGYRVLEAANGVEALDVAREHDGPIHLMLSDVVMPQMSGNELAERLRSTRPQTKVLLMSGYPRDVFERQAIAPHLPLLEKPFTIESLLRRIRSILDEEGGDEANPARQ